MKKITKKQAKEFSKNVHDFLLSVGAVEVEGYIGPNYELNTVCGRLNITIPSTNAGSTIATIFCRFENPQAATERVRSKRCNPYSGKWNFHEYTTGECLRRFIDSVWELLPQEAVNE